MTETKPVIQMVVGYDFSSTSQVALERAIALAQGDPQHMMHIIVALDGKGVTGVLESSSKVTAKDAEVIQDTVERYVTTKLESMAPDYDVHFFVHVRLGSPAEVILRLCTDVGAHLVLVGSHGLTGLERLLMGSVSEQIVREAKCPVLVVRPREYADVDLKVIVDAPEGHAEEDPYVRPSLYAYRNREVKKRDPWSIYNR